MTAGILAYGAVVALLAAPGDPFRGTRLFGVPADRTAFSDLMNVLTGIECGRRGFDVLVENPCDPMARPMNYPRLWLLLGEIGVDATRGPLLGTLLALGYLAGALFLLRRAEPRDAPAWLAFLLSPSSVLLVERGNNDAVAFALVVAACALLGRSRFRVRALGHGLVLAAAMLKLYPIAAAVGLARETGRRALGAGLAVSVGFLAYVSWTRADIAQIVRVVPRATLWSYGLGVLPRELGLAGVAAGVLGWSMLAGVAGVGLLHARQLARTPGAVLGGRADERLAFLVGSAIYGSTFLIGHNFDYRLVFLLLCYPLALSWREVPALRSLSLWFLASAPAAAWLGFFEPVVAVSSLGAEVPLRLASLASWAVLFATGTGSAFLVLRSREVRPASGAASSAPGGPGPSAPLRSPTEASP